MNKTQREALEILLESSPTDRPVRRYAEAYITMSDRYRPAAPSDGMGSVFLTDTQLKDPERLASEAARYAVRLDGQQDKSANLFIGKSKWAAHRAFVFAIEAARLLCCGGASELDARKLLNLALEEMKRPMESRNAAPRRALATMEVQP